MIFLVRHGEAAAGWGDHPDPGLSELGHRQATGAADTLVRLGATRCLSSPMQRCRETAAPFEALTGAAAVVAPQISEIASPANTIDRPVWLKGIMAGTWPQAGDSYVRWREDMLAFVEALSDQTVVFSHFVAINALAGKLAGHDRVTHFRPAHASITLLKRNPRGGLDLEALGDERASIVL